jgi:hypothetical protein
MCLFQVVAPVATVAAEIECVDRPLNRIRASLMVAIAYLVTAGGLIGFGLWIILDGISGHETIQRCVLGALSIVLALGIGREVGELCFVTMDDDGVEQLKFLRRGRFVTLTRFAWEEVDSLQTKGLWMHLKSASSEIRINLSFFNDMNEAAALMESRLPKGIRREE